MVKKTTVNRRITKEPYLAILITENVYRLNKD